MTTTIAGAQLPYKAVAVLGEPDPANPNSVNVQAAGSQYVDIPLTLDFRAGSASLDYTVDFSVLYQQQLFQYPVSFFADNSNNPAPLRVYVSNTGQTFPVPAYSSGWYSMIAQPGSTVQITSPGPATTTTSIAFANYYISPVNYAAFNASTPAGGAKTIVLGVDATNPMSATNPLVIGGAQYVGTVPGGPSLPFSVDSQGRLAVVGAAAGGSVYGNNAVGIAPTQPPVLTGGVGADGFVHTFLVDNTGRQQTLSTTSGSTAQGSAFATTLNPILIGGYSTVTGGIATGGTFNALQVSATGALSVAGSVTIAAASTATDAQGLATRLLGASIPQTYNGASADMARDFPTAHAAAAGVGVQAVGLLARVPVALPTYANTSIQGLTLTASGRLRVDVESQTSTAAITTVAQNVASVSLLAASTSRKGYVINNTGSATLYVAYAATSALAAFTYPVSPGATLEVLDKPYMGAISGIWASAGGGSAIITELQGI